MVCRRRPPVTYVTGLVRQVALASKTAGPSPRLPLPAGLYAAFRDDGAPGGGLDHGNRFLLLTFDSLRNLLFGQTPGDRGEPKGPLLQEMWGPQDAAAHVRPLPFCPRASAFGPWLPVHRRPAEYHQPRPYP